MGFGSRLRSAARPALVVLSLFLLVGGSLWWLLAVSYGQLLFALVVLAVTVLVFVRLDGDEHTGGETESSWNAIPNWQYNGRHAESGGLTRGDQEQALEEIHEDATERHTDQHRRT